MSGEDVQPRMAAWLGSLGRDVSIENAKAALRTFGFWRFSNFINEAKRFSVESGRYGVVRQRDGYLTVVDQAAFTDGCLALASAIIQREATR